MSRVSKDYILDTDPPLTLRVREKFDGILEGTEDHKWWADSQVRIEIDRYHTELGTPCLIIPESLEKRHLLYESLGRYWGSYWDSESTFRYGYFADDYTFKGGIKYLEDWIKENNLSLLGDPIKKEEKKKEVEPFTKIIAKNGVTEIVSNTDPPVKFLINNYDSTIWIQADNTYRIDLPQCFSGKRFLGMEVTPYWGQKGHYQERWMNSSDFDNPDIYEDRCSYIENWIRDNIDGDKLEKEDCFTKTERVVDKELKEDDIPREVNYSSLISRQCISEDRLAPKPITFEERVVYLLKQLDEKIDRLEKKIDSWQEKI